MIQGHCECGLVSFEADCKISDFSHCHCSQCRRLHGAAYVTFAEVETGKFRYVTGKDKISIYKSSPGCTHEFCMNCGSNILVATKSYPGFLYLSMGVVTGNPDHPAAYHEFVGSKAPWHEITDDAPQFEGRSAE